MSIRRKKEPSLLSPIEDAYTLPKSDADRLLANIQASLAQRKAPPVTSSSEVTARTAAPMKPLLLVGATSLLLATMSAVVALHLPSEDRRPSGPEHTQGIVDPSRMDPVVARDQALGDVEPAGEIPSADIDDLPTVEPPQRSRTDKSSRRGPPPATASTPPPSDTLDREMTLITNARQALNAGDGARALALLGEHERQFPHGWLANDRAAERIIVLCTLGREADARREAVSFLDGRPESPLTRRVDTSCAGKNSSELKP